MNSINKLSSINERIHNISRAMDIETNPHKRMAYRIVLRNLLQRMEGR